MNEHVKEKRERFIFYFSVVVSLLSLSVVFAIMGMQIYIRWFLNQNFAVVGGSQLEVLTASVFALVIALASIHRSGR